MYHCYFLINYIGPPKDFFLSFGPLFKKFAHHCLRQTFIRISLNGPHRRSVIYNVLNAQSKIHNYKRTMYAQKALSC